MQGQLTGQLTAKGRWQQMHVKTTFMRAPHYSLQQLRETSFHTCTSRPVYSSKVRCKVQMPLTVATGPDHIVLRVADPLKSVEWYSNTLGLEPVRVDDVKAGRWPQQALENC